MNLWRWIVAAGCAYEISALHERSPLPTISNVIASGNRHPVARVIMWAWCGGWAWHFMGGTWKVHTCTSS